MLFMLRSMFATLALLAATQVGFAQEVVLGGEGDTAQPAAAWASRCVSTSRQEGLDCSVSQRAVAQGTGQLLGSVVVRIPPTDKTPVILVTAPLGLFIPGGISLDVDGTATQKLDLQLCDRGGCYARATLAGDFLNAMIKGKALDVVFQDTKEQPVKLPMSLAGFGEAFAKIK